MIMPDPFFMLRICIEARALATLAERRRLPRHAADTGYLVHSFLRELFGGMAPSPFSIERETAGLAEILAYADFPAPQFKQHADAYADPFHHSAVNWRSFADKPMPTAWDRGGTVGFKVRVCPVMRRAKPGPAGEASGREMDVFLARIESNPSITVDRYLTYIEWLGQAFERSGAASLCRGSVEAFQLRRLIRRNGSHDPRTVPAPRSTDHGASGRPDATITGQLIVEDAACFASLLRRGVGRHRAFGFGMILLRPPVT
jgi:CRISPR system Cascade subunit CasE